jgi:predicted pyridoxine 5'-phosphate oxidase superfamily flavin-nucleotide-binding protein
MSSYFNEGQIEVQERVNSRWLADRMVDEVIHYTIGNSARAYIEARDIFFLATVDAEGRANYSYKGGDPRFVRVLYKHTVDFPVYDCNGI